MKLSPRVQRTLAATVCAVLCGPGCRVFETDRLFLLNSNVDIPAGGGTRELMFHGLANQLVTISLAASKTSMIPQATLVTPDATQSAVPPASSSVDGFNSASVTLPRDGTYRLVISDASGQGGQVTVRVELGA
ncbi:MAG: hypothetical protein HRF43_01105 [Phycisphaerae bacterium]